MIDLNQFLKLFTSEQRLEIHVMLNNNKLDLMGANDEAYDLYAAAMDRCIRVNEQVESTKNGS